MSSLWPRLFRSFRRPWRIVRREGGGLWIESKDGRTLLYVYPKNNDVRNYKKPSEEEALDIVRAIARLSKPRARPRT
jgi:hypothetical protein